MYTHSSSITKQRHGSGLGSLLTDLHRTNPYAIALSVPSALVLVGANEVRALRRRPTQRTPPD